MDLDTSADAAVSIFAHWQQVMGKTRAKLDEKRRKLIRSRLRDGYTPDALMDAITGCSLSPFHMGDNENGARYDGLELILRDAGKVDQFIDYARNPPRPSSKGDAMIRASQRHIDEFVNGG